MMLADKVDAVEAERIGMIYKWFVDESFETEAMKIAEKLARLPTKGLGYTKRLLNRSFDNGLEEHLAEEAEVQVHAAATSDFKEGVNAFLEKRRPNFTGE